MNRAWPLTIRGTGALVLALCCFLFAGRMGVGELVYFGVLLLAVIAAAVASLWLARRTDAVVRTLSTEVAAVGRTSLMTVRVAVRSAVPSPPGRWSDALPETLAGDAAGVFPALGSGLRIDERIVELTYEVRGVHRGVLTVGPLRITGSDPFGLARRLRTVGATTAVTVVPALIDLPPISGFAGAAGGILHTTTEQLGQGADNLVARPYLPGDSMRRIHWRATAHRDELMVRQEEQEATPEATVVLDRSGRRYGGGATRKAGADAAFETAVTMAVSAAARLAKEGYSVSVIDADGTALTSLLDGGDGGEIDAMLVDFASLTAYRDDRLGVLPARFAGVTTGPVVLITGRCDEADAAALAPIAHHSSMPVLLTVAPEGEALDVAAEAGWRCTAIRPGADLLGAWAAVADRGAGHVVR